MKNKLKACLGAYAGIVFLPHLLAGLVIFAVTLTGWQTAAAGLVAVAAAMAAGRLLKMEQQILLNKSYIYNPLLAGLAVGYLFQTTPKALLLAAVMGGFTLALTAAAAHYLATYCKLPVLSLPFVLAATMIYLASKYIPAVPAAAVTLPAAEQLATNMPYWLGGYLKAFGTIFFMPTVQVGLVVAIAVLATSRIMFFYTLLGYYGSVWFSYIMTAGGTAALQGQYSNIEHFNGLLIAMALGTMLVPTMRNYILTVLAVCVSVICVQAMTAFWGPRILPGIPYTFNIVTLTIIYFLGVIQYPYMSGGTFATPEAALDHYLVNRLPESAAGPAAYRPIRCPFAGKWTVWQGINGKMTHRGKWRHAYDFYITDENGESHRAPGTELHDYYAYRKPVLAPVKGKVVIVVNHIEDNPVGVTDSTDNWGNLVIIEDERGYYVKLCHFATGTVAVAEGTRVEPGTYLGLCGNSGYSAQPHIHIQVQLSPQVGAYTVPFSFSGYSIGRVYQHRAQPAEQEIVEALYWDKSRETTVTPPVGETWEFSVMEKGCFREKLKLTVGMADNGSFYLDSGEGKLYFGVEDGVFGFYGIEGKPGYSAVIQAALPRLPLAFDKGLTWRYPVSVHYITRRWYRNILLFLASFQPQAAMANAELTSSDNNMQKGEIRSMFPALNRKTRAEWQEGFGFVSFKLNEIELKRHLPHETQ
ncbi:MAG: peptidoglycan DD-metalloendopeptidase family protein [bacterium]|nr:peptidoglycan DD-metalloendopeptidase family protein [bacterium]